MLPVQAHKELFANTRVTLATQTQALGTVSARWTVHFPVDLAQRVLVLHIELISVIVSAQTRVKVSAVISASTTAIQALWMVPTSATSYVGSWGSSHLLYANPRPVHRPILRTVIVIFRTVALVKPVRSVHLRVWKDTVLETGTPE